MPRTFVSRDCAQGTAAMSRYLRITDPTALPDTQNNHVFDPGVNRSELFTIDRRQFLDSRPSEVLAGNEVGDGTPISSHSIRSHFERLWGYPEGIQTDAQHASLATLNQTSPILFIAFSDNSSRVLRIPADALESAQPFSEQANALVLATRPCKPEAIGAAPDALFYVITPQAKSVVLEDIITQFNNSLSDYRLFWSDFVESLELAYPAAMLDEDGNANPARSLLPQMEVLDLSGPKLAAVARRLSARKKISVAAANQADEVFVNQQPSEVDVSSVEERTESYLKIKSIDWAVTEEIETLKSQATSLGYELTFSETWDSHSLKATAPRVRAWHTRHSQESPSILRLLYESSERTAHAFSKTSYTMLEGVSIGTPDDIDPWVEKEKQLNQQGYVFTHRFVRNAYGYVTLAAQSLQEIIDDCAKSDVVRRKTALMLPVEEMSLTQGVVTTRYLIIRRPTPGINTVAFPSVALQQNWTYRSALTSAEVGELLSTVSLAPGESRKLTSTRSSEVRSETKTTTTSLLDVTDSRTNDFSSEVERESRREKSSNSQMSMSANFNTSADFGMSMNVFDMGSSSEFGFSSSGSREFSTKDFDRSFNRTVQKTASSLQRKQKLEATFSSTATQTTTTSDSSETVVKNINEGRTLNLLLFSVNKRMTAGLRLNAMSLVAFGIREVVEGSGILPWRISSLTPAGLDEVAKSLWNCGLPAGLEALPRGRSIQDSLISNAICESLKRVLTDDLYPEDAVDEDYKLSSGKNFVIAFPPLARGGDYRPIVESFTLSLVSRQGMPPKIESDPAFADIQYGNRLLTSRTVHFPAEATYLDAQVGAMPATEDYYERMRDEEIRQRRASSYGEFAKGLLDEAKARGIGRGQLGSIEGPLTLLDTKLVAINYVKTDLKRFTLELSGPLPAGDWQVMYGRSHVADIANQSGTRLDLVCNQDQQWLDSEGPLRKLVLLNLRKSQAIMSASHDLSAYFPWLYEIAFRDHDYCGEPVL